MITKKSPYFKDVVYILIFLNAFLVIVGYAVGVAGDIVATEQVRVVKQIFLLISIAIVFYIRNNSFELKRLKSDNFLSLFIFLLISVTTIQSFSYEPYERLLTFVIPLLYVYWSVKYLLGKYKFKIVNEGFTTLVNLIYLIPILSFLLFGGNFEETNIYGKESGDGFIFVSNHFGWAGVLFILSSFDLVRNYQLAFWRKAILCLFCFISLYIILISGSRSSWVSLLICGALILYNYRKINIYLLIASIVVLYFLIDWQLADQKSALHERLLVTEEQSSNGEIRFIELKKVTDDFNKQPSLWLTGVGMFNYDPFKSMKRLTTHHNSYAEILFGGGIFSAVIFVFLFVIQPLKNFIKYYSKYFIIFPPLVIIPFFESNLTGGQFLFFPWFMFAFLYWYRPLKSKGLVGQKWITRYI